MAGIEEARALHRLSEQWGVAMPPATSEALLAYGRLLLEWNVRINLTGADSLRTLVSEHFIDAFAVASRVAANVGVQGDIEGVDVGSGGGLPGIPVMLLLPTLRLTLVEPVRKKVAFLRTAIRAGDLGSRAVVCAEHLEGGLPGGRTERFDLAFSRATFHPSEWLQRSQSLVRPGGQVLALSAEREVEVPAGLALQQTSGYADGRRWLLDLRRST